ncbi:hypothetical protein TKK_0003902 [Trichogramma kaykai]
MTRTDNFTDDEEQQSSYVDEKKIKTDNAVRDKEIIEEEKSINNNFQDIETEVVNFDPDFENLPSFSDLRDPNLDHSYPALDKPLEDRPPLFVIEVFVNGNKRKIPCLAIKKSDLIKKMKK